MLSNKYIIKSKNLPDIFKRIIEEEPPLKFNIEFLKKLGFKSSNDYKVIRFLKDLGFLLENGSPTHLYYEYRNPYYSRKLLGRMLIKIYSDIFCNIPNPTKEDQQTIKALFSSTHKVSDQVSIFMTNTFYTLLEISDINHSNLSFSDIDNLNRVSYFKDKQEANKVINFNIDLHLPITKDREVYNLIFKSLKEHF